MTKLLLAVFLLLHIQGISQCPENRAKLDYWYYNQDIKINEQKELLDDVIDCCKDNLPNKTDKQANQCAYAYHTLGNLFLKIGELERGHDNLQKAINLYRDPVRKTGAKTDLAKVYSNQNTTKGRERSINIYKEIIASGNIADHPFTVLDLMHDLLKTGQTSEAEYWALQLENMQIPLGNYLYFFHQLKGQLEQAKGNMTEAFDYWELAKITVKNRYGDDSHHFARVCLSMAEEHYLPQRKYDEALQELQNALVAYVPNFNSTNVSALPKIDQVSFIDDDIMYILSLKADIFYRQYQAREVPIETLDMALESFDLIVKSETTLRQFYESETANELMIAKRHETMELALEICFELYHKTGNEKYVDQALHYSELVRDILLKERIKTLEGEDNSLIPDHLVEERDRIAKAFNNLKISDLTQRDLAQQKEKLETEWSTFLRTLQQDYPSYFQFKYSYFDCDIAEVRRKILANDQALIEYFIGQKNGYAIVITKTESAIVQIPLTIADNSYIEDFIFHITGENGNNRRKDLYEVKALKLYEDLIDPIKNAVVLPERLLIIPDGHLENLPFDALMTQKNGRHSLLLEEHICGISFSAGILLNDQRGRDHYEFPYLGIAPVQFLKKKDEMSYSLNEVTIASEILEGNIFHHEDAIKNKIVDINGTYRIIHFATHASFNSKKHPYIYLYNGEELSLPEIYNLNLNADLVILSACEGNLGTYQMGEGVMSLARGFHYTGCQSLMTTQWEARQDILSELVLIYIQNIKNGMDKDIALGDAKRQFLMQSDELHSDPYFWAGLVQFGKTDQLYSNSGSFFFKSHFEGKLPTSLLIILAILGGYLVSVFVRWRLNS